MRLIPALLVALLPVLAACHRPRTTPAFPRPAVVAPATASIVPHQIGSDTARAARPDSLGNLPAPDSSRGTPQPHSP